MQAYRLYIIWGRHLLVTLLPAAAVLAYLGGTIAQIYLARNATFEEVTFGGFIGNLIAANVSCQIWMFSRRPLLNHMWLCCRTQYSISLGICFYSTSLITLRIIKSGRALRSVGIQSVLGVSAPNPDQKFISHH
jgi:hypothetical protein